MIPAPLLQAESAPDVVLAITYWLHMLATVVWIGGLSALSLIVIPSARAALDPGAYARLLGPVRNRLQQVGWFCLGLLVVTGMFQMSSSPAYNGFLAIDSPWAAAILAKHAVIGLMILASAYMTWGVLPALNRAAILQAAGKPAGEEQANRLRGRETTLLRLNLALSVIVLLLTAWARAVV